MEAADADAEILAQPLQRERQLPAIHVQAEQIEQPEEEEIDLREVPSVKFRAKGRTETKSNTTRPFQPFQSVKKRDRKGKGLAREPYTRAYH